MTQERHDGCEDAGQCVDITDRRARAETAVQRASDFLWAAAERRGEATISMSVFGQTDEIHIGDVFRVIRVHIDPTETAVTLQKIEDVSA